MSSWESGILCKMLDWAKKLQIDKDSKIKSRRHDAVYRLKNETIFYRQMASTGFVLKLRITRRPPIRLP